MVSKKTLSNSKNITSDKSCGVTMAQLLAKHGNRLVGLKRGNRVKGKIISINSNSVNVDIGGKSEGLAKYAVPGGQALCPRSG